MRVRTTATDGALLETAARLRYEGDCQGAGMHRIKAALLKTALACAMEAKAAVCVFPEGAVGTPGTLQRFSASLFEAAIQRGSPVLPAAIRYSRASGDGRDIAWTGNTALLRNALQVVSSPVVADLRLAPTIATRGRTRAAVANEARRAVAAQLEIAALAQALPVAGGFERDLPAALTRVLRKHGIDLGGPPDLRASLASFGRDSLDAVPIPLDAELELGIPLADHAFREFNAHSPLAALLFMLAAAPAPRASTWEPCAARCALRHRRGGWWSSWFIPENRRSGEFPSRNPRG